MSVRHVDTLPAEEVKAGKDTKIQVLIGPDQGPNFALRRFIMEPGGGMPLHTNKVEHEQYVLSGSAKVQIGDDIHHVKAGDVVYIPGGVQHNYEAEENGFSFLCVVPNQPDAIELVDC
jgi:quercetin dioxygenase-like cupin family protein|tara:strand:+ start:522 stop:875 length:354 start_codon:yes stop_codon:yes gene_type:complete